MSTEKELRLMRFVMVALLLQCVVLVLVNRRAREQRDQWVRVAEQWETYCGEWKYIAQQWKTNATDPRMMK